MGPTATGKSQLGLEVAVAKGLPIVNCDSLQIYKGLKVGSALPSREAMRLAPHHLYAYVEKGVQWTAADYVKDVTALLNEKTFAQAIFCGGSGFYIQALEKGMYQMKDLDPEAPDKVKLFIDEQGWERAHAWVLTKDPDLQRTIHANDHYRIRRAMEIIMGGGGRPTELQRNLTPSPLEGSRLFKVALFAEKDVLKKRVEARAKIMLRDGFVEEVEELVAQGWGSWAPLRSVGYNEVCQFLRGEIPRSQLVEAITIANIKLIKKQLTWFKRDKEMQWFHVDSLAAAKESIVRALALT